MNDMRRTSLAEARTIKIHGAEAFEGMRRAGRLAAETLDFITPYVRPGMRPASSTACATTSS